LLLYNYRSSLQRGSELNVRLDGGCRVVRSIERQQGVINRELLSD
jgi:hypothetical protein